MAMELDATGLPPAGGAHAADQQVTLVAETAPGTPTNGTPQTTTIALDATGTTVHLPAGTDTSHPVQVGNDLEFIQPDGSIVLIPNGAVAGLVIFVGDVEIPADTVAALFSANNITPAEGGQGGAGGSHGNYDDPNPKGIGESFGITGLLAPNSLNAAGPGANDLQAANLAPVFLNGPIFASVSEEGLGTGNPDTSPNPDDTTDDVFITGFLGGFDANSDPLTYSLTPVTALQSDGFPITWTGSGTNVLVGSANGNPVLIISVVNSSGQYTVTLLGPIDHPVANAEDDLPVVFNVTVKDTFGASASTTFTLSIEDDSPIVNQAQDTFRVDEDGLATAYSTGNHDDGTHGTSSITGTLNIRWGADNEDAATDTTSPDGSFTQDGALGSALTGRSLTFDSASPLATVAGEQFDGATLRSHGDLITIQLSENGTKLVGVVLGGENAVPRTVFEVTLSDDGNTTPAGTGGGAFNFKLFDQLDHASGGNENDLKLTFNIVATDFDHDSATGSFSVIVNDDTPVLNSEVNVSLTVDEDDIDTSSSLGSQPNDGDSVDGSFTGPGGVDTHGPANASGSLASVVTTGADDALTYSFMSETAVHDYLTAYHLHSQGSELSYDLQGNTLYAFVNAGGQLGTSYDIPADRKVFTLELDQATGKYTFSLFDQLDHASGNGQNDLAFDIGGLFKATDFDGDSVGLTGKVTVHVTDDVPVLSSHAPISLTVDEDDVRTGSSVGTSPNDGNGDGSFTGPAGDNNPGPANATSTSGSLLGLVVSSGADEKLTFGFIEEGALRDFMNTQHLTSGGMALSYDLQGTTLYGFVNAGGQPGTSYDVPADREVFSLQVNPTTGAFTFSLYDQLDHSTGNGQNNLSIDFGAGLQATDYDGDSLALTGKVSVNVTDDVPALIGEASAGVTLNENDLLTWFPPSQSVGTSPADGSGDGSDTEAPFGNVLATGHLSSVVNFGADGPQSGGAFSFSSSAAADMTALGLTSKGGHVVWTMQGGQLVGYVESGSANSGYNALSDRTILTVSLQSNGDFAVREFDQLDHVATPAGTADTNTVLRSTTAPGGSLPGIDLGAIFQATDYDGDTIKLTGKAMVTVVDDVPQVFLNPFGTVTHDETPLNQDDDTTSSSVVGQFSSLSLGTAAFGYARDNVVAFGSLAGADEPRPATLSLTIAAQGIDSGLSTTDGHEIYLYKTDTGLIVGREAHADGTADASGSIAFALAADQGGRVSIAQYISLHNPVAGSTSSAYDDPINLAGKVSAFVTVTDYDGDTVTTSTDIGGRIVFDDDGPSIGVPESKGVDEDDLSNGNDDVAPKENSWVTGDLKVNWGADSENNADADHSRSLSFATAIADNAQVYDSNNNALRWDGVLITFDRVSDTEIYGKAGNVTIFKVTLDDSGTGSYRFDLYDKVDHPQGSDSLSINFGFTAKDADGDTASKSFAVLVADDKPAPADGGVQSLHVDEDDIANVLSLGTHPGDGTADGSSSDPQLIGLGLAAMASGSLAASVSFGADGPAAGGGFGFASDAATTLAALGLTSKGGHLSFVTVGHAIVAFVNGGGGTGFDSGLDRPVFSLELDPSTGSFRFHQYDQLDHVDGNGENTDLRTGPSTSLPAIDFGAVITATDYDGDSIALTGKLTVTITDDVPEVSVWTDDTVTIDETAGKQANDTTSNSVASLFSGVGNVGVDADLGSHPIYARDDVVDFLVNGGTDDNVSKSLTLRIDNAASGLSTTDGQPITLYLEDGLIVGRIGGDEAGAAAFAISIDGSGQVSIAQFLSLEHPTPGASYNESVDLAGKISAVLRVEDYDHDVVIKDISIGDKVTFLDDGPSLTLGVPAVVDGLDFGTFTLNGNAWGNGSGVATGTNGGWTIAGTPPDGSGAVQLERVGDGYLGMHASSGGYMVDLDASPHDVKISQTLNGLANGQTYDLRFEAGAPSPGSSHLEIWFGGTKVADISPTSTMQQYLVTLTGGSGANGNNLLEFRETGAPDNQGTYLANISVGDIVIDETHGIDAGSNDIGAIALFGHISNPGSDPDMGSPEFAQGHTALVTVNANFGADGPKDGDKAAATTYALSTVDGSDSGLTTTAGKAIYLFNETNIDGSFVVGRYDANGGDVTSADDAAFAFRLDPGSGVLSIVQYVSLHQPNTASYDEGVYLKPGSLSVSVTITDGDGDAATQTADVSVSVRFEDDGPHAVIAASGSLAIDESAGDQAGTNDALGDASASAVFPGAFGAPIEVAIGAAPAVSITGTTYGADGVAAVVYSLTLSAPGGVDSGLDATDGRDIFLFKEGNLIVGREGTAGGLADVAGTVAFAVSVDGSTGVLSVAQYVALHHPNPLDANEAGAPLTISANVLQATVTVTDGDGDSSVASVGIGGQIAFRDDGPTLAQAPLNQISNGDFTQGTWSAPQWWGESSTNVTGWAIGQSPVEPGTTDLGRSPNGYLGMTTSNGAEMIDLGSSPGNIQITQSFGSGQLTAGQSYAIQFEAGAPFPETAKLEVMWRGQVIGTIDPSGPGQLTSYSYIVTAGGDANDALTFREIGTGNDPVPGTWLGNGLLTEGYHGTYLANVKMATTYVVDEDGLPSGNHDVPPSEGDAAGLATSVTGVLGINWGADNFDAAADGNAGNTALNLLQDTANAAGAGRSVTFTDATVDIVGGTLTSKGDAITVTANADGTILTGTAVHNGVPRTVFEVSLSDDGTGAFRFILRDAIDHAANGGENDVNLTFHYTAKDSDGDAVSGSFSVGVDDDLPVATEIVQTHAVYESELSTGTNLADDDKNGDGGHGDRNYTGNLTGLVALGGDGIGAYVVETTNLAPELQALTSGGVPLTYSVDQWNTLTAMAGNVKVFEFNVGPANGQYFFHLFAPLDHVGDGNGSALTLDMSSAVTARDADGDTLALHGQLFITVNDDAPVTNTIEAQEVDETTTSAPTNAFVPQTLSNIPLNIAFGADNENPNSGAYDRKVVFDSTIDHTIHSDVTSNGYALQYVLSTDGTTLTAYRVAMLPTPWHDNAIEPHYIGATGRDWGPDLNSNAALKSQVFSASLSDADPSGSYTFSLYDNLDHGVGHDTLLPLNFGYNAVDGDGDATPGSFTVNVGDTTPTASATQQVTVNEAGLPFSYGVTTGSGLLGVDWNADEGAAKHIVIDQSALPELYSGGVALQYVVDQDASGNDELVAYKGAGRTAADQIFTLGFAPDTGPGQGPSYVFALTGPIDHSGLGADTKAIPFSITAYDSDGDHVDTSFTINVKDDVPVVGPAQSPVWFTDNFDGAPTGGYFDGPSNAPQYGAVALLASGTNGIVTKSGAGDYALLTQSGSMHVDATGPFTRFDGYKTDFQGGYVAKVDVYIDPASWGTDKGFDYSVAANGQNGVGVRDFIFHLTSDGSGHVFVGADNNSGDEDGPVPASTLAGYANHSSITQSGWYTLEHIFHAAPDGSLAVDLLVLDGNGNTVFTQTLNQASDSIEDIVGGNRYGWFTTITVDGGLPVDNLSLSALAAQVDEDDLGNGSDTTPDPTSITAGLNVSWGADNNDPDTGTADRHLVFTTSGAPAGLKSHGVDVEYVVGTDANGNGMLTAYRGTTHDDAHKVFTVALNDDANGSYQFTLLGNLDHAAGQGQNDLPLTFAFNAIDSDGDSAGGSFTVNVHDDVPTARADDPVNFDEDGSTSGNVLANDVQGADGATLTDVKINGDAGFTVLASLTPVGDHYEIVRTEGTYTFKANGDWSFTPAANYNGPAGFSYEITDGDGDKSDPNVGITITVNPVNDAPTISGALAGSVFESGDVANINEAGPTGPLEPAAALLSPAITMDLGTLLTTPSNLTTVLADVTAALGSASQAIAVIWDYLDDIYTSAGPNQIHVNEAFTRLGAAYASMLKAGTIGSLIDVTAKYTPDNGDIDTLPQRNQSLHDNLLGNLTNSALDQRYGAADVGLRHDLGVLVNDVDGALLSRPYFEGNQGQSDAAERAWDVQHGYVPAASGQLTINDPDVGDTHTWSNYTASGTYGTFTLDAAGKWTYVLDDARAATQALSEGETHTETFSVTVTDSHGATGTQQVVISVTGSNDAPVIAGTSTTEFYRGFDSSGDTIPDHDDASNYYGQVQLVASGTGGIATTDSQGFALVSEVDNTGPFTKFDGYRGEWPGDWTADVKVYLDTGWPAGSGFDYSVASSAAGGDFLRDFIFHVTKDTSTDQLLVGGSNNTNFAPREDLESINHYTVTQSGWYTLEHQFHDNNGVLEIHLNLVDASGAVVWTETRSTATDTIPDVVGGNRYGWFTFVDVPGGLPVDGLSLDLAGAQVFEFAEGSPNESIGVHTTVGDIAFSDVDLLDVHSASAAPKDAGYVGSFSVSVSDDTTGDGAGKLHWTFNVDDAAIEHLGAGQTMVQTYTVTVADGHGGFDTVDIPVTITGTNDAPTAIALGGTTVPADSATGTVVGSVEVTDIDSSAFTFAVDDPSFTVTGTPGNYQLVTTGHVGSLPPSITITATDDGGLSHSETFALTPFPIQLFDNAGHLIASYTTIQGAVNGAIDATGQYIVVPAGTYDEDVTIDRGVEIRGANAGSSGTGVRGSETVIDGQWTITTNHAVDIDGFKFNNTSPEGSGADATIAILKGGDGAGHVIENSVFYSDKDGGDRDPGSAPTSDHDPIRDDRAIFVSNGAVDGHVIIDHNLITGDSAGKYGTASWGRGIWSDGGGTDLTISNNTVDAARSAINLDDDNPVSSANPPTHVTGNIFDGVGSAISLGANWHGDISSSFSGNVFTNVDLEFNAQNLHNAITLDAGAGVGSYSDVAGDGLDNDAFQILGGTAGDSLTGTSASDWIVGNDGADDMTGGGADDVLIGGAGVDTAHYLPAAVLASAKFSFDIATQTWTVATGTAEGTDHLQGVEIATDGTHRFLLVGGGGFAHIQDAIDAAQSGDTILIAPGTYTESHTTVSGAAGLYINTPNLTLLGYSSVDGQLITSASGAQAGGPVVISGAENNFGANHWIDTGGTNTVIEGLHLQAGPETTNKLVEVWADNVTLKYDFIDVYAGGTTYTYAAAVYLNDNGTAASDTITSYTIDHNILNEGIIVSNGVGAPPSIGATQQITNNQFIGTFDPNTGEGRYDTVAINGQVAGIGWLLEPSQTPTITGNTFNGNATPFLLRGSDNNAANLPTAAQIQSILDNNGDANLRYVYVVDSLGHLVTAVRNDGSGPYHSFAVTNTIDTMNLALDSTSDAVFAGKREYEHTGDTLIVQSGATGTLNSGIMVNDLTVIATVNSADLNLTLETNYADGSPIPGGGVIKITLGDYAPGAGANVDVTGNALDNIITDNSGHNVLSGLGGNDTFNIGPDVDAGPYGPRNIALGTDASRSLSLVGLAGSADTIDGGAGTADKIVLNAGSYNGFVLDDYNYPGGVVGVEQIEGTSGDDIILMANGYLSDAVGGGVTIDGNGGNDAIQGGAGNDTLNGGSGNDLISGLGGNDLITGGLGDDEIYAGAGNDGILYTVGDGNDVVDGGSDSGGPGPDYDILAISGDATARTFTVGKIAGGDEINPHVIDASAVDATDLFISYTGPNAGSIRADEIERVKFNLVGDDTIVFGDTTGTSLAANTIFVTSGSGNNTFDLRNYAGVSTVLINDTDVVGSGDTDVVKLAGKWVDWTITQSGQYFVLTNGSITIQATNIENYFFQGENGGAGATVPSSLLLEQGPSDLTTAGLSILENSANGSAVGSVAGVDANSAVDPLSYAFAVVSGVTQDAGGRFAINAATGEITVANGLLLDYETNHSHQITVEVTDSKNQHYSEEFTVTVGDVNETPAVKDIVWNGVVPPDTGLPNKDDVLANLSAALGTHTTGFTYALIGGDTTTFSVTSAGTVSVATGALAANHTYALTIQATETSSGTSFSEIFNVITGTGGPDSPLPSGGATNPILAGDDVIYASNHVDVVYGGGGDDTIYGQADRDTLHGGEGQDHLYGGSHSDTLYGEGGNDYLDGGTEADSLDGGDGDDILIGGGWADTLSGGAGADTFRWGTGYSPASGSGHEDVITDYSYADHDVIDLQDLVGMIAGGKTVSDYVRVTASGASDLRVEVNPLQDGHFYLAYTLTGAAGHNVRIHIAGADYVLNTSGVTADPLILDLDGNGVHLNAAASFDLDHDGQADKIAWPGPHDGILISDLDHSGKIENGNEVFSPSFGEGGHANSLEALKSYDSNGDGKVTADDAHFADIGVWTDTNGNGVSDQGELHSLGDLGVVGIDLGAEEVDFDLDGSHVFAQGTFELSSGETHQFLGVDLGAADPLDVPPAVTGAVQTGTDGADNFAVSNLNAVDFIADYNFEQGDSVDLSALLGDNSGATKDNAADYLHYDDSTGHLSVDTDGAANGANFVDVAILNTPVADVKVILDDGVDVTVNHIG